MRIIKRRVVSISGEKMAFEARFSGPFSVCIGLLGALVLTLDSFLRAYQPVGEVLVLVLCPALGAILLGIVLFNYTQSTVIDVRRGLVVVREKVLLPVRTVQRRLDEFDSVRAESHFSVSEGRSILGAPFFTMCLCGPRFRLPLFDLDDYSEAVRTARRLSQYLQRQRGPRKE